MKGLYRKFDVSRTDGRDEPRHKHHGCRYFVLDLTHDPHSKAALLAYADSCEKDIPRLAEDLRHTAAVGDKGFDLAIQHTEREEAIRERFSSEAGEPVGKVEE